MPSLTRAEAAQRTSQLTVHTYDVDLDLTGTGPVFRSSTTIVFDAAEPGAATFLDIKPEQLHQVRLNGREVDVTGLTDGRLTLTGLAAVNRLEVIADMRYSTTGEGMHRYVDPADGRTYLYAFVYVDHAPRLFACFDQPDLKAVYRFTVATPAGWTVLGNSTATQTAPGRWELAPTAPQSTYLTTVVAGPYRSFTTQYDGVPLAVHCRASLADSLAPHTEEIFDVTARCLDEYAQIFGLRYPFEAFHQVFVPEFSVLSLDHPGCVLLRELYLAPSTESERETRAVVLAHGISLMWMAGLVTHQWWDEFWLGQAFADYMAHRVTATVTRFPGPPTTFSVRRKAQAYVADQRPSTHAVSIEGNDVQSTLLEMDRITYFKGHAVLRQLATAVGEEGLRKGLGLFFAAHKYATATYADFLAALAEATGTDLTEWGHQWFGQAGVTVLEPVIETDNGRISSAAVVQHADGPQTSLLRPHTLEIGRYGVDGSAEIDRVTISGARTELPQLIGAELPELLLLNDGDLTYAKIRFDPHSRAGLRHMLPRLSAQNRAMVWCALLLAVQDGSFPPGDYLDMVVDMLGGEPELSIITEALEQALDVLDRYLAPSARPAAMAALAAALTTRLARTGRGDERAVPLLRALVNVEAEEHLLRRWLAGDGLPTGGAAGLDLGWPIRYRLAVLGAISTAELASAQRSAPGAEADQWAAKCRAARPDPVTKALAWEQILTDPEISSYQLWALAEGFWQPEQPELADVYVPRFFEEIAAAAARRGDMVTDLLLRVFYPRFAADRRTLAQAATLLADPRLTLPVRRSITDFTDDLRRVVHARELQAAPVVGV